MCTPTSSAEHCAPHAQHLPPDVGSEIWAAMDTHGFGEGALERPTGGLLERSHQKKGCIT